MKKCLKKLIIIIMAVACACSIHISVSAEGGLGDLNWGSIEELINGLLRPESTTKQEETTTASDPNATTTDPNATTTDPVNNTGSGTVPSSENKTTYPTVAPDSPVGELTTVEQTTLPGDEEDSSYGSLLNLLEQDSAAIIVQTPTETFTLNTGIVVNDGNKKDGFTWQQAALIAAAVLFVILAALVGALVVQRSKRVKEEEAERRRRNNMSSSSNSAPVPVEVMTPERIAELLGSAANSGRVAAGAAVTAAPATKATVDMNNMTSEESAAAIKAAILMGQLSNSYSDPLIRKYTEEPVMISPVSKVKLDDSLTGAEILEATTLMLEDITGNEKYASDISGLHLSSVDLDDFLADTKTKICPECQNPVASGDVFCHSCGAYVKRISSNTFHGVWNINSVQGRAICKGSLTNK